MRMGDLRKKQITYAHAFHLSPLPSGCGLNGHLMIWCLYLGFLPRSLVFVVECFVTSERRRKKEDTVVSY